MVLEQSFVGEEDENPYFHLREFQHLCLCLRIVGMTQETSKWNLFLLSLTGITKQWYARTVGSVQGGWEELNLVKCASRPRMFQTCIHLAS